MEQSTRDLVENHSMVNIIIFRGIDNVDVLVNY